tara:strand:- start:102 stop:1010 length:909 start_codon:yes stop_codon:yes gene_type:complete
VRHEAAIKRLERDHLRRGLSPVTTAARVRLARKFLSRVGKPVGKIETDDVRSYLAQRRAEGLAGTSLGLELSHLRAFFRAASSQDPTKGLRVAAQEPRAPLLLSRRVVQDLLLAASTGPGRPEIKLRDRACLELLYGTGVRVSEAAATKVPDLDLVEHSLRVRPAKLGPPRPLPIPEAAVEHIARYLAEGRPLLVARGGGAGDTLLLAREGRPVTSRGVTSIVDRVAKRAGLHVHAHALRRALATHLVEEGVTVEAVRQLLGHADLETTASYVAVKHEELHEAVSLLDLGEWRDRSQPARLP